MSYFTMEEITNSIKYAAVDRANWVNGALNWDYVSEDIYYEYSPATPTEVELVEKALDLFKINYEEMA